MSDLTPDDKIARLVHLVLEAVDHRLADIRIELQQIDDRLARLEQSPARADQPGREDNDRFDRLRTEIDRVRGLVESLATGPAAASAPAPATIDTSVPLLPSLATMTAALPSTGTAFPTTSSPARADDVVASALPTTTSELIDLDRLSDLLSARLGQLNLPRPN